LLSYWSFAAYPYLRCLHSFPTRRSSDLYVSGLAFAPAAMGTSEKCALLDIVRLEGGEGIVFKRLDSTYEAGRPSSGGNALKHKRSEEHTSELQSRENLVCRLLLEKKKEK